MSTTATPNPSIMARFAPRAVADLTPSTPTPGLHDGVVKTKHLKKGMHATPYFNGKPHGSERIIESVEPATADGSTWTVTFSSPHAPQVEKAAYRWQVAELVGAPLEPVRRRKPAEHLTYKPFAEVFG